MNTQPFFCLSGLALIIGVLAGCGGSKGDNAPQSIAVAPAVDSNPDPDIFETTLVAAPHTLTLANGQRVSVFAYNGQVPGPEIRVKRGDRVIVHFQNNLPEGFASTIHWHGVELNNQSDGTEHTQDPVLPGETFVYDFIAPRAGTFWYHPHVRGIEAVAAGLYAPLVVTQPEEAQLVEQGKLPSHETTVVLSDLAVDAGGRKDLTETDMLETMNGTEGNVLLVNGRERPTLSVSAGEGVRLRLVNAAIARYYRLSVPGHTLFRVGGQGGLLGSVALEGGVLSGMRMPMDETYTGDTGAIEIDQGYERGEILLAPGERADVVIVPQVGAGQSITLQWLDFARGRHQMVDTGGGHGGHGGGTEPMEMEPAADDGLRPSIDLLHLQVRAKSGNRAPFTITEGLALVAPPAALEPERTDTPIELQEDMEAMMADAPRSTWFKIDGFSGVDGRTNFRTAQVGEVVEWETHNDTAMHHPFHLHGFSFQPTQAVRMNHEEGYMDVWSINAQREFVDTINLPAHTSVVYAFEIRERPVAGAGPNTAVGDGARGDWMLHCHIFQHGDNGMMSFLRVE